VLLYVMRWNANEAHPTAGGARVFLGSGYTLFDGGFEGTFLVPVALAAVVVLAVVTVVGAGTRTWAVQLGAAAVAAYYPLWLLFVFVKKWEDEVYPGEGVVALVAGYACIATGLFLSRPRERTAGIS
jgi:hypothetical protein